MPPNCGFSSGSTLFIKVKEGCCWVFILFGEGCHVIIKYLYMGNPIIGNFTNNEDPDEKCGISSGSTLFIKVKKDLHTKEYNIF